MIRVDEFMPPLALFFIRVRGVITKHFPELLLKNRNLDDLRKRAGLRGTLGIGLGLRVRDRVRP